MVREIMDFISANDAELGAAIKAEYARQQRNIELIASENFVSETVMLAASTVLTNKYAEGYPGKRYYGGCEVCGQSGTEPSPLTGLKEAFRRRIMPTCSPTPVPRPTWPFTSALHEAGRHHSGHGSLPRRTPHPRQPGQLSGKLYNVVHYGVPGRRKLLTMMLCEGPGSGGKAANDHRPEQAPIPAQSTLNVSGQIAREVRSLPVRGHGPHRGPGGGGLHPNPVPYADFVTTHHAQDPARPARRLRSSASEEYAQKTGCRRSSPASQGGPLMHIIAAKAVAFGEALKPVVQGVSAAGSDQRLRPSPRD
jgi:glycine hydroxymethyltransferase